MDAVDVPDDPGPLGDAVAAQRGLLRVGVDGQGRDGAEAEDLVHEGLGEGHLEAVLVSEGKVRSGFGDIT